MSGAEAIASIALGFLPLLVSAAQRYERCFHPFIQYKKFATEIEEFHELFLIQKNIFRNQCFQILENNAGHGDVGRMLQDQGHPLWAELEEQVGHQLGQSMGACVSVVKMIEKKLRDVEAKSKSLGEILRKGSQTESKFKFRKGWKSRLTRKLKQAFSRSRLSESIDALRKLNEDFRTLCCQIYGAPRPPIHALQKHNRLSSGEVEQHLYNPVFALFSRPLDIEGLYQGDIQVQWLAKFRHAIALNKAVLGLHMVPWLRMRQDVLYFSSTGISLQSSNSNGAFPVRNCLLYSLAVVLMEISCQRHMPKLYQVKTSQDVQSVCEEARKVLGQRYYCNILQAVCKLLACDFKGGNDLNVPLVQQEFVEDVIRPLEEDEEWLQSYIRKKGDGMRVKSHVEQCRTQPNRSKGDASSTDSMAQLGMITAFRSFNRRSSSNLTTCLYHSSHDVHSTCPDLKSLFLG